MNKSSVKAQSTSELDKPPLSWAVDDDEVVFKQRENRSRKPSVVYYLSQDKLADNSSTPQAAAKSSLDIVSPVISTQPSSSSKLLPSAPSLYPVLDHSTDFSTIPQQLDLGPDNIQEVQEEAEEEAEEADNNLNNNSDSEEVDVMAEERSIAPIQFAGSPSEDGESWYRHFNNYCMYKGYDEAKTLGLFKVLLKDNAALWLDSQPQDVLANLASLKTAFDERYRTPEVMRYKSAKEIFSRRQNEDEKVDDYIAAMQKLARTINAEERMVRYAILNGLKPGLSAFVTQKQPETMEELLHAARLAELTCPASKEPDSALSMQLASVQDQLKTMASQWQKLLSSSISSPSDTNQRTSRSPSPGKRVTFVDERRQIGAFNRPPMRQPPRPYYNYPNSSGMRQTFAPAYPRMTQRPNSAITGGRCGKCARPAHMNINLCPAINKNCNFCGQRGHFSAACRAATRAGNMNFNSY